MSTLSGIKKVFGNWKPTRKFVWKLALAVLVGCYILRPGYLSFHGSYVRFHFLRGRPDSNLRIVDATTRQPISGAYVNVSWYDEVGTFGGLVSAGLETRELRSDANGWVRPYRWIETGDRMIVDIWKPGYRLRRFMISENDIDNKYISTPITLEPWDSVEEALQDRRALATTYTAMERVQTQCEQQLLKLKKRGIDDISQLSLEEGSK